MDKSGKISLGLISAFVLVITLFCLYTVFGAANFWLTPLAGTNHTTNIVYNVTLDAFDADGNNSLKANSTLSYNNTDDITTQWVALDSAYWTFQNFNETLVNGTILVAGLPEGNLTLNLSIGNLTGVNLIYSSAIITQIHVDISAPLVSLPNLAGINLSNVLDAVAIVNSTTGIVNLSATVTDTITPVQAVIFNVSNGTNGRQEGLFIANKRGAGTIWINDTGFNMSLYSEGNYTIAVIANNTLNLINNSVNTGIIYIDNTVPQVQLANITSPLPGTNQSGTLVLNVSVIDLVSGVGDVLFKIINGTGGVNATYAASREGTTDSYSVSINSAHLADSNFTLMILANDSANNLNNSAQTTKVFIDNTIPTIGISCTPSQVNEGNVITCSCSGTDIGSGISSTAFTVNPTTIGTGTKTTSCSITDYSGNLVSASTTYTVEASYGTSSSSGSSSGGSGSTSTTTWTNLPTPTTTQVSEGYTRTFTNNQRVKIGEDYVGVSSVTSTTATIQITNTDDEATIAVGETIKFDTNNDGVYDISATLNSVSGTKADLKLQTISEEIPEEELEEVEKQSTGLEEGEGFKMPIWAWIIIALIVIVIVVAYLTYKKQE